jgi:hypothetical protein
MDIQISHTFDCQGAMLWVMLRSPTFQDLLAEEAGIDREVLSDEALPGGRRLRVKVTARKELPAVAAKAVGTSRLSWVQEIRTYDADLRLTWKIKPNVIPDKIRAEGMMFIEGDGARATRTVRGEISVNVKFVGRQVERQIVSDLERSYERAAALAREWIAQGRYV